VTTIYATAAYSNIILVSRYNTLHGCNPKQKKRSKKMYYVNLDINKNVKHRTNIVFVKTTSNKLKTKE
jgi:hypothetical protein